MAETLLLMTAESRNSLILAYPLHSGRVRPVKKALVKALDNLDEFAPVWC